MRKHSRRLLSMLFALMLLVSLVPMTAAAGDTKTDALSAYYQYLSELAGLIGEDVTDVSVMGQDLVGDLKGGYSLDEIKSADLYDLTGDGIPELLVTYRLESHYAGGERIERTLTYANGQLKALNIDYNKYYICYGNDGNVYFATDNRAFGGMCLLYTFNGSKLVEYGNYNSVFTPEWEIGPIHSQYGNYYYYINGNKVSEAEFLAFHEQIYGNGCKKFTTETNYKTTLDALQFNMSNPFSDVSASDYFAKPVLWAVDRSITGGIGGGMFGSHNGCTRGQVVTFLWAAAGKPEPVSTDNPFTDVAEGDFFYKPVLWAVENGITGGIGDGLFGPNNTCTRSQIVTFLWSAKGKPALQEEFNPFSDVNSADYFYIPVLWAAENGITGGVGHDKFGSYDTCTRAQVVTFLYKAFGDA